MKNNSAGKFIYDVIGYILLISGTILVYSGFEDLVLERFVNDSPFALIGIGLISLFITYKVFGKSNKFIN